ncbi:MAG: hypothetical protein O7E57_16935 [Gammaproteobacteria bacterium]|nr:hypothetical protein [Gammaproteobacteria bacterium]
MDRVTPGLNAQSLHRENRAFAGTSGISTNNKTLGFVPAFYDRKTGRVQISRFSDGRPAPIHLMEGLPEEWAVGHDLNGRIISVKPTIISGFVRGDDFYTREQAAEAGST